MQNEYYYKNMFTLLLLWAKKYELMLIFFNKIETLREKKGVFLLLLFSVTLFFRYPALFNDYYDVDELAAIVQTHEYLDGGIPGIDFKESKNPLYHRIFKSSYSLDREYGWVYVHAITIVFVFLTSFFIYLSGSFLRDFKTGALAAFFYSIFISSFNKDFMATNGEILYNMFFSAGLYFMIRSFSADIFRKLLLILSAIAMGIGAYQIKFHGIFLIIFIFLVLLFYIPYYGYSNKSRQILIIPGGTLLVLLLSGISAYFLSPGLFTGMIDKINYAIAADRKFTLLNFITRFSYRQTLFILWHMIIWIPAIVSVYRFLRNKFKGDSVEESVLSLFLLTSYLMVFGGAARLYYHYFMPVYIPMSIAASVALLDDKNYPLKFIRKKSTALLLIPALFFLMWNTKDIIIRHFTPNAFYNEGTFLFWTRAVLTGRYNSYLLPHSSYRDSVEYIRKTTRPGDRIFVWGNGPEIYYFSKRRMGSDTLWPKSTIYKISKLYRSGDEKKISLAKGFESHMMQIMKKKEPVLFVDTSANLDQLVTGFKLARPAVFDIPITDAPGLYKYILREYRFEKEIRGMKIYRKKP